MTLQIRQAYGSLRRAPGLAAISILTVALGVGAGTALFSMVKAVLLDPLPFPESQRLAWIASVDDAGAPVQVSMEDFEDWRAQNRTFSAMTAFGGGPMNAGGGEVAQRARGTVITEAFFETMGLQPVKGRAFLPEENKPGSRAVILGHALWQRGYGGDPGIVGRSIRVLGMPFTVVGVMPPGFYYPDKTEIWMPWGAFRDGRGRGNHNFQVVGRLRQGVSVEQAVTDIGAISRDLKARYPGPFQAKDSSVVSLRRHVGGEVRPALLMLFGAVGFLILIVCVNVSNLLLVRLATRTREIALRMALGAGWSHVLRQLLTESLMLSLAGGALGLLIAAWSIELIRILLPVEVPGVASIAIDRGVLAFAVVLSIATGILFGMLPAWKASRLQVNEHLKAGSRAHTAGKRVHRAQSALVVSEVSLSLVLVAGAALLMNSLWKLRSVAPGFQTDRVMSVSLSIPITSGDPGRLVRTYTGILREVRALSGVETAGAIRDLPLDAMRRIGHFQAETAGEVPANAEAAYQIASPGYFETMRIPLLRGRDLTDADTDSAGPVAVINAEMARRFWPASDPLGRRIWFDSFAPKPQWATIVGIVGDVRRLSLAEPAVPQAYVSYQQLAIKAHLLLGNIVIRSSLDAATLTKEVRNRIRAVDREGAVSFQPMDNVVKASVSTQRFQTQILGGFAALALLLAAVGLYGVLSYMVTSHRSEIGIRMALGAQPRAVFRMIAGRALALAAAGIVLGLAGYLVVRQALSKLLFGLGPGDPPTLMAAAALLLTVSLAASWLPARRAMRMDPVAALREE